MRVKEYLRRKVAFFASVIEIAISIIVLIAIVIAGIQVVREVFSLAGDPKAHEGFTVFLGHAFNLIIGVEFIKMLAKHTPAPPLRCFCSPSPGRWWWSILRRWKISSASSPSR